MKLNHFILLVIFVFFIFTFYRSSVENMSINRQIILMGDSILDNSSYVTSGSSVYEQLKKQNSNVLNLAKDHSTISDLYFQLDKIPLDMNTSNTTVYISIGGNDILTNSNDIDNLFDKYLYFLKSLKTKLPNVKLFLFNLYVPLNSRYEKYRKIVIKWNEKLTKNENTYNYKVIDLFNLLVSSSDFVYNIEPSESASKKIVNLILSV
jgi:hypothetical protein